MKKTTLKKQDMPATNEYMAFLNAIKTDILQTQMRTAMAITQELAMLYWRIGQALSQKIRSEGWGAKVIEVLSRDIKEEFGHLDGFSRTNLYRMIAFYESYPNCPTAVGQLEENPILRIPWGHNAVLIERVKNIDQRLWYADRSIKYGWSRSMLEHWIDSNLYGREGKAPTNFKARLPEPNSDLAQQALKDPYNLSFLALEKEVRELEVERGLMRHIENFLLELGQGFSFVGRQRRLKVGGQEFFIDMLFYHLELRCYIIIELKAKTFDTRDIGQLNFYLSAVDDLLKKPSDNPSIGLLLCREKNNVLAEYALRDVNKPIGVSSYYTAKITESLPKELKGKLPTIEEIEAELEKGPALVGEEKKKKTRPKIEVKKKSNKRQRGVKK
jgi:predicted nuclease of restriction endonuclease-like (RecB) superfamily